MGTTKNHWVPNSVYIPILSMLPWFLGLSPHSYIIAIKVLGIECVGISCSAFPRSTSPASLPPGPVVCSGAPRGLGQGGGRAFRLFGGHKTLQPQVGAACGQKATSGLAPSGSTPTLCHLNFSWNLCPFANQASLTESARTLGVLVTV